LSEVEQVCNRVGILARGELIACGTINELLTDIEGRYMVRGCGGNPDILQRWITDLVIENGEWSGQLRGEPQEFLATLRLMSAQLIEMKQARRSLEEYFMYQMTSRGITTST
jgi:ABC-2 type transport system ATP-binding protein